MTKYRIVGEVGPENITVRSEWLDIPETEARGVMTGFEIRGWENVSVESNE